MGAMEPALESGRWLGLAMSFFDRRRTVAPEVFAAALRERLAAPAAHAPREPAVGPLPGNPWARRLVVALDAHASRQRWVAEVARERLHAEPVAIARRGHPGIPAGPVPGLPGWSYRFHGIGCCFTREDGTVIDVDFDEHGAEGIDPYFYGRYLETLPGAGGLEATLRRPEPLDEWWMAELDCLRELRWVEGRHRVRLTSLGRRWAEVLRLAFDVVVSAPDVRERIRVALLIEDYPWAAQLQATNDASDVRQRADRCAAARAVQLERHLRASRARGAFAALAVHDSVRAVRTAEELLARGVLDGLTSLALDYRQAREPGPAVDLLVRLAKRAKGTAPPAPYLRTKAVVGILERYRSDSFPAELRARLLGVLLPDAHAGEGFSALLHTLLDYEAGLGRLARSLRHAVPLARADSAAGLALLGTPEAAEILRASGDAAEAKAALALLRGCSPEPGPEPEGHIIEVQGRPQRVYTGGELVAAGCPFLVQSSLENLSKDLGPLLERWWAH